MKVPHCFLKLKTNLNLKNIFCFIKLNNKSIFIIDSKLFTHCWRKSKYIFLTFVNLNSVKNSLCCINAKGNKKHKRKLMMIKSSSFAVTHLVRKHYEELPSVSDLYFFLQQISFFWFIFSHLWNQFMNIVIEDKFLQSW